MEGNAITCCQTLAAKPGRSVAWLIVVLFCLSHHAWGAGGAVEVRRLGLSKVAENTLLTVVLDRVATPRASSRTVSGKPQLVVQFPGARAGRLPGHLEGDELLVQQVLTETASPGGGGGSSWTSSLTSPSPTGSRIARVPAGRPCSSWD